MSEKVYLDYSKLDTLVVFDNDGCIMESALWNRAVTNGALEIVRGISFTDEDFIEAINHGGGKIRTEIDWILKQKNQSPLTDEEFTKIKEIRKANSRNPKALERLRVPKAQKDTLRKLRDENFALSVLSSNSCHNLEVYMDETGLDSNFISITGSGQPMQKYRLAVSADSGDGGKTDVIRSEGTPVKRMDIDKGQGFDLKPNPRALQISRIRTFQAIKDNMIKEGYTSKEIQKTLSNISARDFVMVGDTSSDTGVANNWNDKFPKCPRSHAVVVAIEDNPEKESKMRNIADNQEYATYAGQDFGEVYNIANKLRAANQY